MYVYIDWYTSTPYKSMTHMSSTFSIHSLLHILKLVPSKWWQIMATEGVIFFYNIYLIMYSISVRPVVQSVEPVEQWTSSLVGSFTGPIFKTLVGIKSTTLGIG